MADSLLDDLSVLNPIPGAALVYFVSGGVDYQGSVTNLFVGRTLSATVALGIRSTGAAFDLQIASSEVLTANRALSIVLGDAARTLTIGASASISGTNTGDQTTVSGNAGTATALQTARSIYGNNFDGTAALAQIIASAFGGTGNGFTKFSGPTTAEKTFTLPDANATILTTNAAVTVAQGGTGLTALGTGLQVLRVNAGATALEFATLAGGGNAQTADPLSQFAATTSAELRGVISDENGTGALLFSGATSPVFVTPDLGTPSVLVLTNATGLPPTTGISGWPANASGVLTNDGAGALSWGAGGSGATTALDNLASVAVNTSLISDTNNTDDLGSSGVKWKDLYLAGTASLAAVTASGTIVQTSNSATAIVSGPNGATNPVWAVDNSVASAATGLSVRGRAAGAGVDLTVLTSGTNENLTIGTAGTGRVQIASGSGLAGILRVIGNVSASNYFEISASDATTSYLTASGGNYQLQGGGGFIMLSTATGNIKFYNAGFNAAIGSNTSGLVEINSGTIGTWRDLKVRQYYADQTITAGGTTGDRTINKSAGTVNIAASGTSVTVTSSLCSASSQVFAVIRTNDTTATIKNVVPGAGSFVITLAAAATAEVSIGWWILNF